MGMSVERRPKVIRGALAACLALFALAVQAHPHAWIYAGTTFIMSSDGRVAAIEQDWQYDSLLTDALLEDMAQEAPGKAPDINHYAAKTMQQLRPFNYFLRLMANGQSVPIGQAVQFNGELRDEG